MYFSTISDYSKTKLNFSGHETFPFRYTWLPKCIRNLPNYPDLFLRDDAIVILGVGKNMVRSMRYWCESLGLIEIPERGSFTATQLGNSLFGEDGWDPYLEDPATLWLLHWKLASNLEKGSTWYLAFTRWGAPSFTRVQLKNWIFTLATENPSTRVTQNSLKRDIDVFLRTYIQSRKKIKFLEDSYDCPLVELGLINEIEPDVYEFTKNKRDSLPDEILLFALNEYWEKNSFAQNSISFENLQYSPGSPGRIFGLTENSLYDRIERIPSWAGIFLDTTAGMRNIFRISSNRLDSLEILSNYYTGNL